MNYESVFGESLDALRSEGNYPVFANLERKREAFPHATSTASSRQGRP